MTGIFVISSVVIVVKNTQFRIEGHYQKCDIEMIMNDWKLDHLLGEISTFMYYRNF